MKKYSTIILGFALVLVGTWLAISYNKNNKDKPQFDKLIIEQEGLIPLDEWVSEQNGHQDKVVVKDEIIEENDISIFFAGDVMLSRVVGQKMVTKGYHYPFEEMQKYISNADIAFANLESPIISGEPVGTGSFVFRADPEAAEALAWAGFDIVNLANNHILNKGQEGLLKTFEYLEKNNIEYCGADINSQSLDLNIKVLEKSNIKVAFLCYGYGPDYYQATEDQAGMRLTDELKLKKDLIKAREQADIIIVSMHEGVEYEHASRPAQQDFAHLAIDHGADLVVGHHPHVVQEVELYKNKYILYSLGNFVFDQMWSTATKQGLAVKVILDKDNIKHVEFIPIMIEDYAQPRLATNKERDKILKYLQLDKLSGDIKNGEEE